MEEKLLKEILASLQEIKERFKFPHVPGLGGDPGPEMNPRFIEYSSYFNRWYHPRIPTVDYGPDQLLDKENLAKLKVAELERYINDLRKDIETIQVQVDLIKLQYKIKSQK